MEFTPPETDFLTDSYSLENGGFHKWRGFGQTKNSPFSRFYCTRLKGFSPWAPREAFELSAKDYKILEAREFRKAREAKEPREAGEASETDRLDFLDILDLWIF